MGNIARMPGEPVLSKYGELQAYLVETRSIAGLSGSPVFLNPPDMRYFDGKPHWLEMKGMASLPIGMMLGYHKVQTAEDQIPVPQHESDEADARPSADERNTGLAVVVPMERILEIMEDPKLIEFVDGLIDAHFAQSGFRPAGAPVPPPKAAPPDVES